MSALHAPCDYLFAARAPELIINSELTENIYIELCEPAEPDLNQVGFIGFCQLKTYSASLFVCLSCFVLQAMWLLNMGVYSITQAKEPDNLLDYCLCPSYPLVKR